MGRLGLRNWGSGWGRFIYLHLQIGNQNYPFPASKYCTSRGLVFDFRYVFVLGSKYCTSSPLKRVWKPFGHVY